MTELVVILAVLGAVGLILAVAAVELSAARRGSLLVQTLERDAPHPSAARADLPAEVIALAQRLGAAADNSGGIVRLTQQGQMWMKPDGRALPFTARQSIAIGRVGFVWNAELAMMPGVKMRVIDCLVGDHYGLRASLFGVVPLARLEDGVDAFRGEAMRYLAELVWNPDAILCNRQLAWRVIDARALTVATGDGERRCEVRLLLDHDGDVRRIEADDRPRAEGRDLIPGAWFCRGSDFRVVDGRRLPFQAEAGWILNGTEFVYWRGTLCSWSAAAWPRSITAPPDDAVEPTRRDAAPPRACRRSPRPPDRQPP